MSGKVRLPVPCLHAVMLEMSQISTRGFMHELPTGSRSQATYPVERDEPRAMRLSSLSVDCLKGAAYYPLDQEREGRWWSTTMLDSIQMQRAASFNRSRLTETHKHVCRSGQTALS